MARYKVAVIAVLLKNNKTAAAGELIEENQFATKVEDLVKGGYVVKPTADEIKEWKKLHEKDNDSDAKAEAEAKAAKDAKADADAAEAAKLLEVKK